MAASTLFHSLYTSCLVGCRHSEHHCTSVSPGTWGKGKTFASGPAEFARQAHGRSTPQRSTLCSASTLSNCGRLPAAQGARAQGPGDAPGAGATLRTRPRQPRAEPGAAAPQQAAGALTHNVCCGTEHIDTLTRHLHQFRARLAPTRHPPGLSKGSAARFGLASTSCRPCSPGARSQDPSNMQDAHSPAARTTAHSTQHGDDADMQMPSPGRIIDPSPTP